MSKVVKVPLAEIKEEIFVRVALDDDRVIFFVDLYQSGAQVPPLELEHGTNVLLDGRHRKAALEFLERKEASCKYVKAVSRLDAIVYAIVANMKRGPKPPTSADIDLAIRLLRKEGMSDTQIALRISAVAPLPAGIIRKHVRAIKENDHKKAVRRAASAVVNDCLTVEQAAAKYAVPVLGVRASLNRSSGVEREPLLQAMKGDIAAKFHHLAASLGATSRKVIEKQELGEVDNTFVAEVYADMARRIKKLTRSHEERQKRFVANGSLYEHKVLIETQEFPVEKPKLNSAHEPQTSVHLSDDDRASAARKNLGLE